MEIDMKMWEGLKWNDANFACKYDKSIALNIDIDNFFQKIIWMRRTRYEQFSWGSEERRGIVIQIENHTIKCNITNCMINVFHYKKWTHIVLSSNFIGLKLDALKTKQNIMS